MFKEEHNFNYFKIFREGKMISITRSLGRGHNFNYLRIEEGGEDDFDYLMIGEGT